MVSSYMFQKIRSLKEQGKTQAEIARTLEIDPKTVAKYIRSNSVPRYKPREKSTRVDEFSAFSERVGEWLTRTPTLTDRELYELLLPEGYRGSERTINRKLKSIRPLKPVERFFEQEYEMAEQTQFDFKEKVELPFTEGIRIVHLHFCTLPFSDICYVRGYPFKNYECFIDGIHSFFETIGGVTKNIRFDNLSPCVKKVLKGTERLYTDDFKKATAHYGFGLLPCAPAKGSDKGDVERDIRTFSSRIKNRVSHDQTVFKDYDHLNEWLMVFMQDRQTEKTKELFLKEQSQLKVLAIKDEAILCKIQIMPVSGHGMMKIGRSVYSVPDAWISKDCEVIIGAYTIEIQVIGFKAERTVHARKIDGENSLKLEHILPSLVRKPQAMVRWAHRDILFPEPICKKFYAYLKKLEAYGAEREYLRAINLVLQISLSEIFAGMELILENESKNPFEDLKELLFGERRPCNVIELTAHLQMKSIKPELSNYDSLIPKEGS